MKNEDIFPKNIKELLIPPKEICDNVGIYAQKKLFYDTVSQTE